MASLITANGFANEVTSPLELHELQILVGGYIKYVNLTEGRVLVVQELAFKYHPVNETATKLAGKTIHGDVVLCSGSELAYKG
jgi:hypothetical protein